MKLSFAVALFLLCSCSLTSFSQSDDFRKHSFGLEHNLFSRNPNIGITYRKFKEGSRRNFRASFFIGGNSNFNSSFQSSDLFFKTGDSAVPVIGINNTGLDFRSFRRIELGFEKEKQLKRLTVISGIALTIAHHNRQFYSSVYQAEEVAVERNGITYFQYQNVNEANFGQLNSLNTAINDLSVGLAASGGTRLQVSSKLYVSIMLYVRADSRFTFAERNDYFNESYKEHLTERKGGTTFNLEGDLDIGLHYRF